MLINQSFNCSALRLDGNHKRCFVQIHLNQNAVAWLKQAGSKDAELEQYVTDRAGKYFGIACGAVTPSPLLHPTHWDYGSIQDGQKPLNLRSINPVEPQPEPSPEPKPSDALSILRTQTGQGFPVLPVEPETTPEPPNRETDELAERVRELHARGVRTVKAIAWEIAGIKPSRSAKYRELSQLIKGILIEIG
ncbi:MAG: hypothetical protein HC910_21765 [Spirulinaceae cyanobacterium SM2_1_0]|nr:hypothetical protein [Spirulinaceae cyanobacterium SM2_1_0]